jgi:hypothetical protein
MGQLRQIYFWARDEIGVRAPMVGEIAKGEPGPSGVTYPVTVTNNGLPGKGVIAEGLPTRPLAAANPRRPGTVSRSQTITLPFMGEV